MVTLTTGIMFLLFSACTFGCGEFYKGGHRPRMKWSAIAESLRNTCLP